MGGKDGAQPRRRPVREVPSRFRESAQQAASRKADKVSRKSHGDSVASRAGSTNSYSIRSAPTTVGKGLVAAPVPRPSASGPPSAALKDLEAERDEWRAVLAVLQATCGRERQTEEAHLHQLEAQLRDEENALAEESEAAQRDQTRLQDALFVSLGGPQTVADLRSAWWQHSTAAAEAVHAATEQRNYVEMSKIKGTGDVEELTRTLAECAEHHSQTLEKLVALTSDESDQLNREVLPQLDRISVSAREFADVCSKVSYSAASLKNEELLCKSLQYQLADAQTLGRISSELE